MSEFDKWDSFYLIVGAAAGALIGLQFVVLTLIAGRDHQPRAETGAAFATPTIIHFSTALFLSALIRAPWQSVTPAAVIWGLIGAGGILYIVIVARRMKTQTAYRPEFEDWLCHVLLPLAAYAILGLATFTANSYLRESLFGVGTSALLLLFIGIHNAWDAVTYHVFTEKHEAGEADSIAETPEDSEIIEKVLE